MPRGGGRRGGGSRGGGRRAAGGSRARGMARMMAVRRQMMRRRRRRRMLLLVGGMAVLGYAGYKMSQKNVQRVEEHTGEKAEELTDEQLEQAMDQLGIEKETMTDEEWAEAQKPTLNPATWMNSNVLENCTSRASLPMKNLRPRKKICWIYKDRLLGSLLDWQET
jgi:hypothetical protein